MIKKILPTSCLFALLLGAMPLNAAPTDGASDNFDAASEEALTTETAPTAESAATSAEVTLAKEEEAKEMATGDAASEESAAKEGEEATPPKKRWRLLAGRSDIFDLDGYMRVRGNIYHNLDLGNEASRFSKGPSGESTSASFDMRLRLEPVINITQFIRVAATFDVLDNVVFGSNPAGDATMLSHTQGDSFLADAIKVRRLWLEADFFSGHLRVIAGRVPSHFGLGMYYNDGNCLDCDLSDAADRIQLVIDLDVISIAPTFDMISSGLANPYNINSDQPLDFDNVDDAFEFSLQLGRRHTQQEIAELTGAGKMLVDWGAAPIFRHQARAVKSTYNAATGSLSDAYYRTDANTYALDAWVGFYSEQLSLELEGLFLYASYKVENDEVDTKRTALQWGFAFEGRYRPKQLARKLEVSLIAGVASGDDSKGFGFNDPDSQAGAGDTSVNNFQFHPSYHVDMILFRQLVGTVTDAFYIKPSVSYLFTDHFGGMAGVLYGQALYANSTPSREKSPLGVEINVELFFRSDGVVGVEGFDYPWGRNVKRISGETKSQPAKGGVIGSLSYGLLFPLKGWRNPNLSVLDEDERDPETMVHAFLARVGVVF